MCLVRQLLVEEFLQFGDGETDLFHGVAVADCHGVVFESVEIDGDAVGGSYFVLAAIAFSDAARFGGNGRISQSIYVVSFPFCIIRLRLGRPFAGWPMITAP